MAKVEQDIEVEIDIPKSLKFKKTIGKIKYKLHEEEVKLIIDIKKMAKEIKRLQERLADADKTLRFYDSKDFHYEVDGVVMGAEPAHKYFVKWGIPSKKCKDVQ